MQSNENFESVNSDDVCEGNISKEFSMRTETSPRKAIKRKTLVSAWSKVEEFYKVYDWLFGENATIETKKRALREMIVWKVRRSYFTPAAILSTIVILETQLKDAEHKFADDDMQIFYSHAFTRFLNFMSSTVRSPRTRTLYEIARELNLETLVVDLRHMCAHGTIMPPLEILRKTSNYCYNWLKDTYWTRQRYSMTNVNSENIRKWTVTKFDDQITLQYQIYDSALQCYLKGANNIKAAKQHLHGKRYSRLKNYYESKSAHSLESILLNHVIRDMSLLIRRVGTIRDSESIFTEAFLKAEYFLKVPGKHTETDQDIMRILKVTNGLFRMLATYGLIEDLYRGLMTIIENPREEPEQRKGASFWANELVKGFVAFRKLRIAYKKQVDKHLGETCDVMKLNLNKTTKNFKHLLKMTGVDMKRTLLFGDSTRSPGLWLYDRNYLTRRIKLINEYSVEIVKNILDLIHPELSKDEIAATRKLIDIQFGDIPLHDMETEIPDDDNCLYTANDLKNGEERSDDSSDDCGSETNDGIKKYGIWSTVPDWQDWSTTPLGMLPLDIV